MNIFTRVWKAITNQAITDPLRPRASAATGYDAGGFGRRSMGWNASKLGPNTLLWSNLEQLRARSRDAVRNSALARSAVDRWESNSVGTGIVPHFLHPDPDIRKQLQSAWTKWVKKSDYQQQLSFYGQQALVARELFEAGECFVRFHVQSDEKSIPLQLQLLESEQCPVFRNTLAGSESSNQRVSKSGIVFDADDRRIGYDFYRGQPYDSMFDPMGASQFIFIPADEMLHIMKPLRAGQLRGEPQMTPVLSLLYEIENYADAERVRKKVASMFAGFISKPSADDQIFPTAPYPQSADVGDPYTNSTYAQAQDPGSEIGKLEPGTLQTLLPGEDIKFPQLPESGDYASFMSHEIHKFAAGCGLTYEQLTGDLRGVNYSSIRAGLLEFRRACEQFQNNIIIHQFCEPVLHEWIKEAVLSGQLDLPDDYFEDPTEYEAVVWVSQGWQWVDPAKEMAAAQMAVRSGFSSRTMVVRETGYDPEVIDNQQAEERKRAAELGLTYDSDPNKVLIGRETQPLLPPTAKPNEADSEDEAGEEIQ